MDERPSKRKRPLGRTEGDMGQLQSLKIGVRLSVKNPTTSDKSVFGPGIAALCQGVRECGSLNAAAKNMRMAYSKAWRVVKEAEETLGMQLLLRDGAHGSSLTEDGSKLLDAYLAVEERLNEEAQRLYEEMVG